MEKVGKYTYQLADEFSIKAEPASEDEARSITFGAQRADARAEGARGNQLPTVWSEASAWFRGHMAALSEVPTVAGRSGGEEYMVNTYMYVSAHYAFSEPSTSQQ